MNQNTTKQQNPKATSKSKILAEAFGYGILTLILLILKAGVLPTLIALISYYAAFNILLKKMNINAWGSSIIAILVTLVIIFCSLALILQIIS